MGDGVEAGTRRDVVVRRNRLGRGRLDAMRAFVGPQDPRRGEFLLERLAQRGVMLLAVIVVRAQVPGFLRAHQFHVVGLDHSPLDQFAAVGIDRVRDVGVELGAAVGVLRGPLLVELGAALVAVQGAEVVLGMAPGTAIGQLAAGHRDERALGPLNDFQIADHEAGIERDRAEGLQPLVRVVHQLDAYFRNFHGRPPSRGRFRVLEHCCAAADALLAISAASRDLLNLDYGRLWPPTRVHAPHEDGWQGTRA